MNRISHFVHKFFYTFSCDDLQSIWKVLKVMIWIYCNSCVIFVAPLMSYYPELQCISCTVLHRRFTCGCLRLLVTVWLGSIVVMASDSWPRGHSQLLAGDKQYNLVLALLYNWEGNRDLVRKSWQPTAPWFCSFRLVLYKSFTYLLTTGFVTVLPMGWLSEICISCIKYGTICAR